MAKSAKSRFVGVHEELMILKDGRWIPITEAYNPDEVPLEVEAPKVPWEAGDGVTT